MKTTPTQTAPAPRRNIAAQTDDAAAKQKLDATKLQADAKLNAGEQGASKSATPEATAYTVRSGDTLSAIAQRTNLDLGDLKSSNPHLSRADQASSKGMKAFDLIFPGDKVTLPPASNTGDAFQGTDAAKTGSKTDAKAQHDAAVTTQSVGTETATDANGALCRADVSDKSAPASSGQLAMKADKLALQGEELKAQAVHERNPAKRAELNSAAAEKFTESEAVSDAVVAREAKSSPTPANDKPLSLDQLALKADGLAIEGEELKAQAFHERDPTKRSELMSAAAEKLAESESVSNAIGMQNEMVALDGRTNVAEKADAFDSSLDTMKSFMEENNLGAGINMDGEIAALRNHATTKDEGHVFENELTGGLMGAEGLHALAQTNSDFAPVYARAMADGTNFRAEGMKADLVETMKAATADGVETYAEAAQVKDLGDAIGEMQSIADDYESDTKSMMSQLLSGIFGR